MHDETSYRNKISYLSYIFALLVILRHSTNYPMYEFSSGMLYHIERFMEEITDTIVPAFFALSGYLFFQNFTMNKLWSKWKSRLTSLVVPYLIWNLLAYLYYVLLTLIPGLGSHINGGVAPFTLPNVIQAVLTGDYNITWYLQSLILFTYTVPLLYPIMKYKLGSLAAVVGMYLIAVFTWDNQTRYAVFFLFGAAAGIHLKGIIRKKYPWWWAAAILMAAIGTVHVFGFHFMYWIPIRLLEVCLWWIIGDALPLHIQPKWWAKISFFLYCAHSMVLESIEKVFWITLGSSQLAAGLDYVAAPLLTISLLTFAAWVLLKCTPVWKLLNGGRG